MCLNRQCHGVYYKGGFLDLGLWVVQRGGGAGGPFSPQPVTAARVVSGKKPVTLGLELEPIQTRMIQKLLLWVEVGKVLESRTQTRVDFLSG